MKQKTLVARNERELADAMSECLKPSRLGYRIEYKKLLKLNKGRGKNKNPYYGRVWERQIIINPRIGCDWMAILDALTKKYNPKWFAESHGEHVQEKESVYGYYNRFFNVLKSDGEKFYLKYNLYQNSVVKREWLVFDELSFKSHVATAEEMSEIAEWLPKRTVRVDERQEKRGIPEEKRLKWKSCRVTGIKCIWKGKDIVYRQWLWSTNPEEWLTEYLTEGEGDGNPCRIYYDYETAINPPKPRLSTAEYEKILEEWKKKKENDGNDVLAERTAAGARIQ